MLRKTFILLSSVVLITAKGFANDYIVTPTHNYHATAPLAAISIFDIYQHNTSTHNILIGWQLVSNNLYPGWDFSLCVLGTCYTGIPATGIQDTVRASGDDGFLGLNVIPNGISGTGTVKMYVYQVGYENQGDTLIWYVNAPAATGISTVSNENELHIFPIPANDVLNVQWTSETVREISISNISGQRVYSAPNSNSVPVGMLSEGIYFITVTSSDGKIQTRRFNKL